MISGNTCGKIRLLAQLSGKIVCLRCFYAGTFPFLLFKYRIQRHKDVQMLLVETALALKIPVYFFSVSVKELGFFGMENALMYLLQNLIYYFFLL